MGTPDLAARLATVRVGKNRPKLKDFNSPTRRASVMSNVHFGKNIESGMFSLLKGLATNTQSSEITPKQFVQKHTLLDFAEIRTRIQNACDDYELLEKPMSLLLIAVDALPSLMDNYGEYTATHVRDFVAKSLFDTCDSIYGSRYHASLGEYVEGRILMLLPDMVGANALDFAEILRKGVSDSEFVWQSETMRITVSIGVVHKPGHNGDQDLLILQADHACSEIMKGGGNRVCLACAACRLRIVEK